MTVQLKLKKEPDIPIEADTITPTHFAGTMIMVISSHGREEGTCQDIFMLLSWGEKRMKP